MNLGNAIKLVVEKRGLRFSDLSVQSKMSYSDFLLALNDIPPRKEFLEEMATILNVKPEYLLMLSLEKEDIPKSKQNSFEDLWPLWQKTFLSLIVEE